MIPVYMHMNSNPHQMSPQGYYCPGYGNNPHQMRMDSPMPMSCEHWPNSGSSGFPIPCYGCCIHGNFSGYNVFRPYDLLQAPHHPCCGSYSGFHPVHHAHPYYIPQHCLVDHQPRYEYDKDLTRHHYCSGCPNHVCDVRNGNSVRIEEQEPEIEKENSRKAVVPTQSTSYPYPIIWIPHETLRNQEHRRPFGSGSQTMTPAEAKAPENTKVPENGPKFWNGCFPLDSDTWKSLIQNQDRKNTENGQKVEFPFEINKLKSLLQGQDGKDGRNQCNGAESGQFPYPMFWIPSQGKSWEDTKRGDMDAAQRHTEEDLPILKFLPFNLQTNDDQSVKPGGKEGNFEHSVSSDKEEKRAQQRSLPVKQSEDRVQKCPGPALSSEKEEQNTRQKTIPVKQSEDQGQNSAEQVKRVIEIKPGASTIRKQSSSPTKASKLPPVCLRVDPLPKKKNGNGNSRSPSPPSRKGEPSGTEEDSSKLPASPSSKMAESDHSGTKFIPVARDVKCEEASYVRSISETCPSATGTRKEGTESEANQEKEVKKVQSTPDKQPATGTEAATSNETYENRQKPVKENLSDEEAATIIQSGYRGYGVRRWEPLKKLKQMAKVREQMVDVKNRIQAIEGATARWSNEKEIAVVGEMVMSLLLKLDAIQGLHPSIRDIRKSLAKELLGLQERLDSLKKSRAVMEDAPVAKQVDSSGEAVDDKTSQSSKDRVDLGQGQLADAQSKVSDPTTEELTVPLPSSAEPCTTTKNGISEQLAAEKEEEAQLVEISLPCEEEDSTPTTGTQEESGRCDPDATKAEILEEAGEDNTTASINRRSTDEKGTIVTSSEKKEVVEESLELLKELPQHVEGDEHPTPVGDENKDVEAIANELENANKMAEACSSFPSENNTKLLELPIGVIDEEQQDPSHPVAQKSSPCTLEAFVDACDEQPSQGTQTGEPVMIPSDRVLNTEVAQQKEEDTNYTIEDTTVNEGGGKSIQVEYLQETPEKIFGTSEPAHGSTVETPCLETNEDKDSNHLADHLESIKHTDEEAGKSQHNAITAAEIAKPQVEAGQPQEASPTETAAAEEETSERNKKLMEENQRLRETMEKLMEAGREQLGVISSLTGRVKSLEKKLTQRKKMQAARRRAYGGGLAKNASRTKAPSAAVM